MSGPVAYPAPDPETGVVRAGDGLFLLPTLHQSVEFAVLVRRAFFALRPTAVAIELPSTIAASRARGPSARRSRATTPAPNSASRWRIVARMRSSLAPK